MGACIVKDNKIIATGYNGFPFGCDDDKYPWERDGEFYDTKYPYVVHAELNVILNARGIDLTGSTIYVSLFPCHECAKAIIQSGVKEIVYSSDKYSNTLDNIASKCMLRDAGVILTHFGDVVGISLNKQN